MMKSRLTLGTRSFAIAFFSTLPVLLSASLSFASSANINDANEVAAGETAGEVPTFATDVLPILQKNCVACHNQQKAEGGLNLESFEAMSQGGDSGAMFETGHGAESSLVKRVRGEEDIMPPEDNNVGAVPLTEEQILLLTKWIDSGATAGDMTPAKASMQWQKLPDSIRPIYAIDTTPNGQFTVVGRGNVAGVYRWAANGSQNLFILNDPSVSQTLAEANQGSEAIAPSSPATHLDLVQSIAINNDGTRIATGGFRDVKIWKRTESIHNGQLSKMLQGSARLSVSPNALWLARITHSNTLELIELSSLQIKSRIELSSPASVLAWSSDSAMIATQTDDLTLSVFVLSSSPGSVLTPKSTSKLNVALKQLIFGSDLAMRGVTTDGQFAQWNMVANAIPAAGESTAISDVKVQLVALNLTKVEKLSVANEKLATSDDSGRIHIYSSPSHELQRTIEPGSPLAEMFLTSDGNRVVAVQNDGVSRCWNTADGVQLWEHKFDLQTLQTAAFADQLAARHKASLDRTNAKLPNLEANLKAESENLEKLKGNRAEVEKLVQAKTTEVEAGKAQVTEGEAMLAAAQKALEEAKAKLDQAEKELAARKDNLAKTEAAKAAEVTKLENVDKTIVNATQATEKATNEVTETKTWIEASQKELEALEAANKATKDAMKTVPVLNAELSSDQQSLVTLRADGKLQIIHIANGLGQTDLEIPLGTTLPKANSIAVLGNGSAVATFDDGRTFHAEFANHWTLERVVGSPTESPFSDRITALDFDLSGSQLAVGSGPPSRFGELKVLNVETGDMSKDFGEVHSDTIFVVRFSPDGKTLATGGADKVVRLHSTTEETPTRTFEGHTHHVLGLAWHDNGHLLASSSADNTVKVWDVELGQAQRTITGFGKEVTSIAFVGRTNQLLSASSDKNVRVHIVADGKALRTISGSADSLYSLTNYALDPSDSKTAFVLSGGQDGTLWIWKVEDGAVIQQIQ